MAASHYHSTTLLHSLRELKALELLVVPLREQQRVLQCSLGARERAVLGKLGTCRPQLHLELRRRR